MITIRRSNRLSYAALHSCIKRVHNRQRGRCITSLKVLALIRSFKVVEIDFFYCITNLTFTSATTPPIFQKFVPKVFFQNMQQLYAHTLVDSFRQFPVTSVRRKALG